VRRAYDHVQHFRDRLASRGVTPADIRDLVDIEALPFTTKSDLRDTYPFGLFASPMHDVVRLHASSGTTGKPIVVAYTRQDVEVWTSVMVRSFAACGLTHGDIVQNAYGYGLFTGGLGAHYGAEALGATVIPVSGGNTDRQIMVMKDFGVTAICCTPSYFIHLLERALELGVNVKDLPLRAGIFGAEPWTDSMRRHIETDGGIQAFDIYGLSEIIGPGVAIECPHHRGLHIFEDHFYPEIIDPDTGAVLPDGAEGELVFTTLTKEALPVVRYRTRDLTRLLPPTARSMRRIGKIVGRSDDMLIIRGVNVFPTQIEELVLQNDKLSGQYQIVVTRNGHLDQMTVRCEVRPDAGAAGTAERREIGEWLQHRIKTLVGVSAEIDVGLPDSIERTLVGKARRVVDQRPKG
jgi:phenylacetate-CoA ligase